MTQFTSLGETEREGKTISNTDANLVPPSKQLGLSQCILHTA